MNTPQNVHLMTDAEMTDHGIDRADYPNDRVWLATWPDRSGWYCEGITPDVTDCTYWAMVGNETDCFRSEHQVHAWLFERVEITATKGGAS
jgi:hypothetical protein